MKTGHLAFAERAELLGQDTSRHGNIEAAFDIVCSAAEIILLRDFVCAAPAKRQQNFNTLHKDTSFLENRRARDNGCLVNARYCSSKPLGTARS
jgi:hypothetical protein